MKRTLCALVSGLALSTSTHASSVPACDPPQIAPHDHPFDLLGEVPLSADAAAVLNNPARHLLLNNSARTIRKLLALSGIFTHTEHAWDALAQAFDSDTDETISALLGHRVVVMWDHIGSDSEPNQSSFLQIINAIDTQWVLSCEVDHKYLKEIQSHLKPVRRDIEQGYTVYAIEQGRYEIVLMNHNDLHNPHATVILAPKTARAFLVDVLAHRGASKAHEQPSILHQRAELVACVDQPQPDWHAAWIVQLNGHNEHNREAPTPSAIVGLLSINEEVGISASFATDYPFVLPNNNAPAGLLSAVGDDAILAVALAQTPTLFIDNNIVEYMYNLRSTNASKAPTDTPAKHAGGPGLILLSKIPQEHSNQLEDAPIALTVMTGLDPKSITNDSLAAHTDQIIYDLFASINPINAPSYKGRFPNAVRTHTLDPKAPLDPTQPNAWPGSHAKFSWFASDLPNAPSMITTLAPEHADTARQVRWIAQAAQNLDAIPDHTPCNQLITTGYFYPSRATKLLDVASPVDMAISKLIDRIDWQISQTPSGISGSTTIKLSDLRNLTQLGNSSTK